MQLAKLFTVAALVLSATVGVVRPASAAAGELRLAAQPFPSYAPIFLAKKKGWLDEELAAHGAPTVTLVTFAAGPPINESFAAGQQDFGFLGDTPAIIGKAVGLDTRFIGKASVGPTSLAVIVAAGSPLANPADLKGKKVAVTKGSYAHHLLALVLQKGGLTFSDVELINLPNGEIPAALIAGNIDAGAVWEPVITKFTTEKAVRVLADGTGLKSGVLSIVASSDIIKRQPEQVKAVLRAYARGSVYIKEHPQEAAELIAPDVGLPPDLLIKVFAKYDYNPVLRDEDIAELRKSAEFMKSVGIIKTAVDIDSFVDRDFGAAAGLK